MSSSIDGQELRGLAINTVGTLFAAFLINYYHKFYSIQLSCGTILEEDDKVNSVASNFSSMGMRPLRPIREDHQDSERNHNAPSNADTSNHEGIAYSERSVNLFVSTYVLMLRFLIS